VDFHYYLHHYSGSVDSHEQLYSGSPGQSF
jgi:hypothetical protein